MSDTDLVVVEKANIPALFEEGGSDPIIEALEKAAAKFKGDVSTQKGRDEIRAFSRKFSTFKAKADGYGKALSDKLRAEIAPINGERNKIEACCDKLRDSSRKLLTDYEDVEKKRVADIETRIRDIENYVEQIFIDAVGSTITSKHLSSEMDKLNAIVVDDSFEEFELAATKAKAKVVEQLEAKFIVLQNKEKEATEVTRLEEERIENERIEREKEIAEYAAEQATREAEEKANAEQKEKDRLAKEAIDKADKENLQAQLDKQKAELEKRQAEDQATEKAALAVEDEKRRAAELKRLEDLKEQKRQDDVENRAKIHKEAKGSMMESGISEEDATIFVTMVKDGLVKHITIKY